MGSAHGEDRQRRPGERELRAFEELAAKRSQTQGEFIRGLILAELTRDAEGVRAGTELVEIKAVWLLLINLLRRWRRAGR